MNGTRYIFIALFSAFIMIDVISMFFCTVEGGYWGACKSVVSMIGDPASDEMPTALIYFTIIAGPLLALIVVGTMRVPIRTVWKVLFIVYLLLNILHSALVWIVMVLNIFGPAKYLTIAGWIPIGVNILSAVFLFVLAVSKTAAGGALKVRSQVQSSAFRF